MKQRFILIGMDDSPSPSLSKEVKELIHGGHIFSGGLRHYEIVAELLPLCYEWINITVPLDAVFDQYTRHKEIIVFVSGDPIFFGFGNTICRRLPDAEVKLYPSFNSLQLLAHRLVMQYDDMKTVSLTGRPWFEFDRALIERVSKIGVLTDREHTPSTIASRMLEYGYDHYTMHVGEHLGNNTKERVTTLSLQEAAGHKFDHPNNLILVKHNTERKRYFGIPDEAFTHLNGRTKMITKSPLRLLTLNALELSECTSFWDIGFCTGSVSIEAKLHFPHLQITAFEIREEGETLMNINTKRFGTPGINMVIADFMHTDLSHYPRPDAVFIGGHGGQLTEMLHIIRRVLLPEGKIVFNSVSKESKEGFIEGIKKSGMELLSSTHITIDAYNPIDIMKARLKQ